MAGNVGSEKKWNDEDRGPRGEQVAARVDLVVKQSKTRVWEEFSGSRFQSRYFGVEWRSSVLLDGDKFVDGLRGLIGGEASFVLGMEVRKSRADYYVVVRRPKEPVRWADWREKLMFGHGGEAGGEGLFMRVLVPNRASVEGTRAFVGEMIGRCDTYTDTYRYGEAEMTREHDKGYARPGRKRKADGSEGG